MVAEPSSVKKKFGPVAGGLPSETVILPRIEMFGFVVVFPRVINSPELSVSTVMYSFDPSFTVKAPVVLSTVVMSTVLDTSTVVVLE